MAIVVGDRLPDATFKVRTPDGLKDMTTNEVFGGKKVALFAVPGAFTPTCPARHLPGFEGYDELRAKGVDTIACVSVNDAFVMRRLGQGPGRRRQGADAGRRQRRLHQGGRHGLRRLAASASARARKRYSMLVDDGVVKAINVEEAPGMMEVSGAEKMLAAL